VSITTTTDFKGIYQAIEEAQRDLMWRRVGAGIYAKVIKLINRAVNVNGQLKRPYSPSYRTWKHKHGYGTTVNLQKTSEMVQSITFSVDKRGFKVYLNGAKNNTKMIRWNSHKNWKSFEWGSELKQELDKMLQDSLRLAGFL